MYKLCAFDLDGTLVNTLNDIADAVNAALTRLGCPAHTDKAYTQMVGDGMRMLCERALPAEKKHLVNELVNHYGELYYAGCCGRSEVYPGVSALLAQLCADGVQLAVASNKPDDQTQRVVAHYLSETPFSTILGQRADIPRKPAPDMLLRAMQEAGVTRDETIYVGDSNVDVRFARAAGVKCIGVAWGFRGAQELINEGADFIVRRPDEIYDIVCG